MIDSIEDVFKVIKKLAAQPNLADLKEPYLDHDTLKFDSVSFSKNITDPTMTEALNEVELSAPYYFFFDTGLFNKSTLPKLKKNNLMIEKLGEGYLPYTHALRHSEFSILFSV